MHEIKEEKEYVILVAVDTDEMDDESGANESLDELKELAETAGAEVVGRMIQKLPHFNSATYIGSGKLEELALMINETGATGIITDDELSPAQMYNLGQALDIKVMDRTLVILDIFAAHARTAEGKLQVEMAQLQYRLSRLSGKGNSLSRLGGGIGTRGPGEKKLEQDRRVIRNRVAQLRRELSEVVSHREVTRKNREVGKYPVFAIVGYTNAGKSTLLNALTGSEILAEDKLFATLDTTTRAFILQKEGKEEADVSDERKNKSKQKVLLTDTVGFIRKLPHNLIDAFRSTLEETKYADYIIHVVDASGKDRDAKMKVVYETLDMLKVEGKKVITIFNKMDKLLSPDDRIGLHDIRATKVLEISAKEGTGLSDISTAIDDILREERKEIDIVLPYKSMSLLADIKERGEISMEEYSEEGVHIRAFVPVDISNKLSTFIR